MKGFLEWFKSSTKMKRWFFLVLLGIVLCCFGFSKIIVQKELRIVDLLIIVGTFITGFTFVILGIIYIQKRTLELLVQSNSTFVQSEKAINMKSLIFNKNLYEKGPNIVAIGGGSGLNTVLEGLKKYTSNVTAIVTIADYGEKATNSRRELGLQPIEDIKNSIISLANNEDEMKKIINHSFVENKLRGLNFGDIYMLAMKEIYANEAIQNSSNILNITGKVLPVTLDEIKICAELKDGTIVEEKEKISEVTYDKVTKINRIYISPSNVVPAPGVLDAIKNADAIIIGPGSLYTNIIPNLLVKNITKTIKESKAIKIYISNIMTEPGQTDNYSVSDHIDALIEHVGKGVVDFCLCDTGEVTPEFVRKYNKMGSDLVEQDLQKVSGKGITILQKDMSMIKQDVIRHNPDAIASAVIELICNDLKFKDMQNDTQYVLLNSKLKEQKRKEKNYAHEKNKKKKQLKKQETKPRFTKKSKFQEKYKERIKSIQNSDLEKETNRSLVEEKENFLKNEVYKKKEK